MKKEYKNLLIWKSDDLEVSNFNESSDYLISQKELNYRLVVNQDVIDLIDIIDKPISLEDLVDKYNIIYPQKKINYQTVFSLLYAKLLRYGIICSDEYTPVAKEIESYLSLSFVLINKKRLQKIIKLTAPFLSIRFFYYILFLTLAFVSLTVFLNYKSVLNTLRVDEGVGISSWLIFIATAGVLIFFHEFGHATATKKLGAESGHISFGFYLLQPVMFADVSDVWKVNKAERIKVNLAGLYNELLIASIMAILFLITSKSYFLIVCSIVLFSCVTNLNPFLRYDGYWVLSDISGIYNLRETSSKKLNTFAKSILGKSEFIWSKKNLFLVIYASISILIITVFISYVLIRDPLSILNFPIDIYLYIKDIISGQLSFKIESLFQLILPVLFYYVLIRFLIRMIKKIKSSRLQKNYKI